MRNCAELLERCVSYLLQHPCKCKAVKIIYDKKTDTLSIILRDGKVAESDEPRPGMILDYDTSGRLVAIELLDASDQVKAPQSVEFALAANE